MSWSKAGFATALPDATGRVMVLVHGLCLNESHWTHEGSSPIEALATSLGYTPIHLRYNSGRSIADNGKDFAALLETMALASGMKLKSENKNVPTGLEN